MSACELCGASQSIQQLNRSSGMGMCDVCYHGDMQSARERQDMDYSVRREQRTVRTENSSKVIHLMHISARLHGLEQGWRGLLKREGQYLGASMVRGLADAVGLGDPKVGDPLFDDFIHIKTRDGGELMGLLTEQAGSQDAIMELLADGGEIVFDGAELHATISQDESPPLEADMLRAMVALGAYMRRQGATKMGG